MALRYLSVANSNPQSRQRRGRIGAPDTWDRFESVLNRLLALANDDATLPSSQAGEAYGLIRDQLLDYTPPNDRRDTLLKLIEKLPASFHLVTDYLLRSENL